MSGPRCVFCGTGTGVGTWRIKGTELDVCERCAVTRRIYVERVEVEAGRK